MAHVRALGHRGVTPEVVLNNVASEMESLEDVFVVTFRKDGSALVWGSGDLLRIAEASLLLQGFALDALRGDLEEG